MWRRVRRIVLITLATIVLLACAGAIYQAISVHREAGRFPPPGRMVDIGGRRLHLVCIGEGEPTVIFEPSGFGNSLSSSEARTEISQQTRVCSYDRAGSGWSDPGPSVITIGLEADDLRRLAERAGLKGPFVLVPSSISGLTAELFARRYPAEVAGMVFLDAANSIAFQRFAEPRIGPVTIEIACLGKLAARLGIIRLLDPFGLRRESAPWSARTIAQLYRAETMATLCSFVRGARSTGEELRSAPPLQADLPLVVLVHERPEGFLPPGLGAQAREIEPEWLGIQQQFAARSSRGSSRVVTGSNHLIGNTQPHAVASAVLDMVAGIRGPRDAQR